jgi:hypothetical protein
MAHHSAEMFARTLRPYSAGAAAPQPDDASATTLDTGAALRAGLRKHVRRRRTFATFCALACYALLALLGVWLLLLLFRRLPVVGGFLGAESRFARNGSGGAHVERICVDMHRHRVRPSTPAVDSAPGGRMEPFAFGSLTFDVMHEEISWTIVDSLGVEPHQMAIHGPLGDAHPNSAPVLVNLGLQRNALLKLAGAANVSRDKLQQILAAPALYYVSVRERLVDGTVRELVRDTLSKRCAAGVE